MMIALKWLLAALMSFAGVMHFVAPRGFMKIVPKWLPAPAALVAISGVFELMGGVGLLIPATQVIAAWGLMALFVAVFPANLNMAVKKIPLGRKPTPAWALWGRLPLQLVLIGWAWLFT